MPILEGSIRSWGIAMTYIRLSTKKHVAMDQELALDGEDAKAYQALHMRLENEHVVDHVSSRVLHVVDTIRRRYTRRARSKAAST